MTSLPIVSTHVHTAARASKGMRTPRCGYTGPATPARLLTFLAHTYTRVT
jgi:hypothetical protein